jgi:hypothetical protein
LRAFVERAVEEVESYIYIHIYIHIYIYIYMYIKSSILVHFQHILTTKRPFDFDAFTPPPFPLNPTRSPAAPKAVCGRSTIVPS